MNYLRQLIRNNFVNTESDQYNILLLTKDPHSAMSTMQLTVALSYKAFC